MPQAAKKVLLVSSDRLLCDCLAARVAELPGLLPAGEAASAAEARRRLAGNGFELVIVDGRQLPDGELAELAALVREAAGARVVVHGVAPADEAFTACVEAGAAACLPRDASLDELGRALVAAAGGGVYFPPEGGLSLFRRLGELGRENRRREQVAALTLSVREAQVLRLLAGELSNRELAERLCLSLHTVKNHVHRILAKMEVGDRRQAVDKAVRLGWLADRRGRERR